MSKKGFYTTPLFADKEMNLELLLSELPLAAAGAFLKLQI